MNLENSRHNMRVLAQAAVDGGQTLLKTPSGKFKENTIFERTIGCGKKLLAKIQGTSYELKKISFEFAKNEVQAKLSRQIHFFSGITKISNDDRRWIGSRSKDFIENKMPVKIRKNITMPVDLRARKNGKIFGTALNTIETLKSEENSIALKVKNQILDEKYFHLKIRNNNEKIFPNEIDTSTIDQVSAIAASLIEKNGEPMRNAIILARLMQSDELKDEKDASAQYKIVKSFADCYLFRGKEKITSDEFSEKLLQIKKEIANQK